MQMATAELNAAPDPQVEPVADDRLRGSGAEIASFLDGVSYRFAACRLLGDPIEAFWGSFGKVQALLKRASPFYRFALSLLFQGHRASDRWARRALPPAAFDALVSAGLLARRLDGSWSTDGMAIVPFDSLNLVTWLPKQFPTALGKCPSPDWEATVLIRHLLRARLHGNTALVLPSASMACGLVAAARGANVTILSASNYTQTPLLSLNLGLNDLETLVVTQPEVEDESRFNVVFGESRSAWSQELHADTFAEQAPERHEPVESVLPDVVHRLAPDGTGFVPMHSFGSRSQIYTNRDFLDQFAKDNCVSIYSFVYRKTPLAIYRELSERMLDDASLHLSSADVRATVGAWEQALLARRPDASHVYSQIVRITRAATEAESRAHYVPFYEVSSTDSLVNTVSRDLEGR